MSQTSEIFAHAALAEAEPRFVAPALVEVTADGPLLVGGRCTACGSLSFPKAAVCTDCLALEIAPTHLPREGVLYSFSIVHQAPKGWTVPYALGYVDLPDGIRVLAHIDGAVDKIAINQKVRLATGRVGTGSKGEPLLSYVFSAASGPAPERSERAGKDST